MKGMVLAAMTLLATAAAAGDDWSQASIAELGLRMQQGKLSSAQLTDYFLQRIERLDRQGPKLHAVIETNPDAHAIAEQLDAERSAGHVRGPLHGIPVLLKDNIDTGDRMLTTAGSLALAGAPAPRDAFLVKRLRDAGAVILGKTNLSEWANIRSTHSSSGWSARGGQTRNPYVLDRNACGSSSGSGVAVAAGLAVVAVGTETDGSITCPSSLNALVGLKPTVGLVSRSGIIPISMSQDTAGPMARSVTDAALLLEVLAAPDADDEATTVQKKELPAYAQALHGQSLKGVRLGVARKLGGFLPAVDEQFERALGVLKQAGAELVDPADIETQGKFDDDELTVLMYEFKDGLNRYLRARGPDLAVHNLPDVIAFNEREKAREMPYFGQELFLQAQAKGPLSDAAYQDARARAQRLAGREGIDAMLAKYKVQALVAPTMGPAWTTDLVNGDHYLGGGSTSAAAVAGYPHLTVPMGQVRGLPVGLSFIGPAWSEETLLRYGYVFEQRAQARKPPQFLPTLSLD